MRYRSVLAATGAAVAATLVLGSTPLSAQAPPEPQPISVDPASAAAGTTVTISGDGCVDDTPTGVIVRAEYLGEDDERAFQVPQGVQEDGSWSASYRVLSGDPLGTYELRATCYHEVSSEPISMTPLFDYPVATFEVTDGTTPPEPVDPTVPSVLSLAIDPTSGPVGTTINVSGDDCTGDLVWFGLFSGFDEDGAIVDLWWANPGSDGAWSDELFVYEAMVPFAELDKDEPEVVPVEPGGDYYVGAWCEYYPDELGDIDEPVDGSGPAPDEIVFSDTIAFEVTAAGVAPRTDPLPVNPVATDIRPQAQPATAVVADPTYTG
jgi:hypothetical protein